MIDIEQVKSYNAELKSRKEQASRLAAQIEMYEKELDSKCAELSRELGISVTKDNLSQIYNDYEAKLKQTLETGRAVLQKIAQTESMSNMQQANMQQNSNVNLVGMQQNNMQIPNNAVNTATQPVNIPGATMFTL